MNSVRFLMSNLAQFALIVVCLIVLILCSIFHFESAQSSLPADCGLVFGAVVKGTSHVSPAIDRRVQSVAEAYKNNRIQYVIMTGGKGWPSQQSEAEVMKRLAVRLGVPVEKIFTEALATSTWENIALSKPILDDIGCKSVVGFSDAYHASRILLTAKMLQLPLTMHPIHSKINSQFKFAYVSREVVATIAYGILYPLRIFYS